MSRNWLVLVALIAVVAVGAFVASGTDTPQGELGDKVIKLEAQVKALENRLKALETRVASSGGAAPNQANETAAAKLLGDIRAKIKAEQYDDAKGLLAELQKKYARTRAGRQSRSLGQELAVFGKAAPSDWGIESWFQGESEVDLGSDKTTLLVFWETWCPHCRREVPKMDQLYSDYKGKGLQVVGVTKLTKSSTPEVVRSFISDNNVSYPIAKENGQLSQHFNVSGIPAAAVVKDGKIVWRGHPANLSNQMLDDWM